MYNVLVYLRKGLSYIDVNLGGKKKKNASIVKIVMREVSFDRQGTVISIAHGSC